MNLHSDKINWAPNQREIKSQSTRKVQQSENIVTLADEIIKSKNEEYFCWNKEYLKRASEKKNLNPSMLLHMLS